MAPPFISYITFNRLGLTVKNLSAILNSAEDFELHILDTNSKDDTWDYIMSLNDSRIRSKERFEVNHGRVYALNMHLFTRRPDQYFFIVDNDVYIETAGWIGKFLRVFEAFPEAGLLGVQTDGSPPQGIPRVRGAVSYQELCSDLSEPGKNYIPGHCMCLRPELIKEIGYFCEENYCGDMELSYRVCNYTSFKAGFVNDVRIQTPASLDCGQCPYLGKCGLDKITNTCFTKYDRYNKLSDFLRENAWRFEETMRDMKRGARPVYCASLLDVVSINEHVYNKDWAMANLLYFVRNAN